MTIVAPFLIFLCAIQCVLHHILNQTKALMSKDPCCAQMFSSSYNQHTSITTSVVVPCFSCWNKIGWVQGLKLFWSYILAKVPRFNCIPFSATKNHYWLNSKGKLVELLRNIFLSWIKPLEFGRHFVHYKKRTSLIGWSMLLFRLKNSSKSKVYLGKAKHRWKKMFCDRKFSWAKGDTGDFSAIESHLSFKLRFVYF